MQPPASDSHRLVKAGRSDRKAESRSSRNNNTWIQDPRRERGVPEKSRFFRDFSLDATYPCARERAFFCARPRTTDVGAREMPRSVVTAGPFCKGSEFAKETARFANLKSM